MKRNYPQTVLWTAIATLTFNPASSQVTISGPTCVKAGSEYHYRVERRNQGVSNFQICVTGGNILDAPANCLSQSSSSVIRITWNHVASGVISINSNSGNQNFQVNIVSDLDPGTISPGSADQLIQQGAIPDTIKCSAASKGSCSPAYTYQWQQSPDRVTWITIPGASGKYLKLTMPVIAPTYYRRKVTETNSGTIKYSGVASLYIIPRNS